MPRRTQVHPQRRQPARQIHDTDDRSHRRPARYPQRRCITHVQEPGARGCDQYDPVQHEIAGAAIHHDVADPNGRLGLGAHSHPFTDANRWQHRAAIAGKLSTTSGAGQIAQKRYALCFLNHLTNSSARSIPPFDRWLPGFQALKIATYIPCAPAVLVAALGACTFDGSAENLGTADGGGIRIDATLGGGAADAEVEIGPDGGKHLLLTEVKTGGAGTEFIEILNPTELAIGLGDYYLADNKGYPFLAGAFGAGPRPSVIMSDFIARFPAGASIAPGEVQIVGIQPDDFDDAFGVEPTYAILGDDDAPQMRTAFLSSIGPFVTLTDSGEAITLFYWDGADDLVVDIDIVNAGASTTVDNGLADKTDRTVDGPDTGSTTSAYRKDLVTMAPMPLATEDSQSYQRTAPEAPAELQTGPGNGLFGHDETSEDTSLTWSIAAPTPGAVVSGL